MTYDKLIEVLLTDDVYQYLKSSKEKIFLLIPELEKCDGFNQKNKWHIYDVYEHILHVVSRVDKNIILRLVALFHDIGKPVVYHEDENGIGHFYDHWSVSVKIFEKYQDKFNLTEEDKVLVKSLIFYHDISIDNMDEQSIIAMINQIGKDNMPLLFQLKRADLLAQSPEFHNLVSNINKQEQRLVKVKK